MPEQQGATGKWDGLAVSYEDAQEDGEKLTDSEALEQYRLYCKSAGIPCEISDEEES